MTSEDVTPEAFSRLKILKIKGVIEFFCNGGKPAIIPDEEVDSIQISLKNGRDIKLFPNPKEEMRVQMVNGYLTAMEGM